MAVGITDLRLVQIHRVIALHGVGLFSPRPRVSA